MPSSLSATFALGFRPFFLLAAGLAAAWVPLWLAVFAGYVALPGHIVSITWHGHEMVFGYTMAVIAGFLLTAVRNWTGVPTPSGLPLAALALLWLAGRVAVTFGAGLHYGVVAAIDLAFIPLLTLAVGIPIIRANNRRNMGFIGLLSALFAMNLWFYYSPEYASRASLVAIDIVILIIVLVGGRVLPFFTGNALRELNIRRYPIIDWLAFGFTALVAVLDLVFGPGKESAYAAFPAAAFNLARMAGWQSLRTLRSPIVWVLHAGYLWIPIALLLKGLQPMVPSIVGTAPLHALTVGAIGMLTLGMMTRVGLGHSGRPLQVPRVITVSYLLLAASALVRVFLPMVAPAETLASYTISGSLWTIAFVAFLIVYVPILTTPRPDGKPG